MSLYLGHSEYRPENCVGATSSLPDHAFNSGLTILFGDNYVFDPDLRGGREPIGPRNPAPHVGYEQQYVAIDAALAFTEPNRINRFMPLPPLQEPFFLWRDETVLAQGGRAGDGADVATSGRTFEPYIISPWLMGGGRYATQVGTAGIQINLGRWFTGTNFNISTARGATAHLLERSIRAATQSGTTRSHQLPPRPDESRRRACSQVRGRDRRNTPAAAQLLDVAI